MVDGVDDSGRFNWDHYHVGVVVTTHVDTNYEADVRRKRNLIYRDVEDCFVEILKLEEETRT